MVSPCIAILALTLPSLPPPIGTHRPGDEIQAQDLAASAKPQEEPWKFDVFVYYWSASLSGNLTVDGDEVDLDGGDDSFSGDPSLLGFLGHFEASHGPWSYVFAPIFVNVKTTGDESGGVSADVEINAQIHEGFVAREFAESWQWLAGARYYELSTNMDLSQGGVPVGSPDNTHSWVDPIVGVRYRGDLGRDWYLRGRADVGGFGVGSEFAWNASALFECRFSPSFAVDLGYRVLHIDFGTGSGSDRLAYDLSMFGPIIGVSFAF